MQINHRPQQNSLSFSALKGIDKFRFPHVNVEDARMFRILLDWHGKELQEMAKDVDIYFYPCSGRLVKDIDEYGNKTYGEPIFDVCVGPIDSRDSRQFFTTSVPLSWKPIPGKPGKTSKPILDEIAELKTRVLEMLKQRTAANKKD